MLTYHRKPVCLSLMSLDMPVWSVVETAATLYQRDVDRFHLLLTEPLIQDVQPSLASEETASPEPETPRLLWLEISSSRVIMTMQGNGKFSYRHFWEQGVYGISRYWLQSSSFTGNEQLRLQNYTRSLSLQGRSPSEEALPQHLRVEYELWSGKVQLGHYVLNLEIH